ncbi:MalY/PatB family protein [Vibrio viridaestus]|uniref:cysteine-S-conjugate beta-lyase n=1 Tax=Vibrio viridaestus TaxID=2487322 RepID=A0A3N9TLT2_9VIBR|nr:PatB family C-S lyase [Vibrio viridaestus]RQW64585.1 putative C-S lyase [Vibrio viridaestus]
MQYNFDEIIDRTNTNSLSVEGWRQSILGAEQDYPVAFEDDLLRFWVADMDFATPPEIRDAIKSRLDQKILGYTEVYDPDYYIALSKWFKRRYSVTINTNYMVFSPGVVPALNRLVPLLTNAKENILITTPSYTPFKKAGDSNNRKVFTSPLLNNDGHFTIDFADIETKLADSRNNIKLFILCNPHNPTGRVWTEQELKTLVEICLKHDVWIISDEIHCDLLRHEQHFTSLQSLYPDHDRIITCTAPSKTFNLAGCLISHIYIPNDIIRAEWQTKHGEILSPLSIAATQAAYTHCDNWLDEMRLYLDETFALVEAFLHQNMPLAKFIVPESTYLAWIDLSAYLKDTQYMGNAGVLFAKEAGVLVEGANMFVDNGKGFIRMNIACPQSIVKKGLERIKSVLI